mmetsp:Transcript_22844/g.38196  ORF Transcript_22844/g.38196 Transcript_22844/m.38196 type:complete len:98 (-) Transcript_22844:1518-1811(-)
MAMQLNPFKVSVNSLVVNAVKKHVSLTHISAARTSRRSLIVLSGDKDEGYKGNKQSLPQKDCAVCGRPFVWRKKWEKNWDEVRYCSERCRRDKVPSK